jgi:hypothetical protein
MIACKSPFLHKGVTALQFISLTHQTLERKDWAKSLRDTHTLGLQQKMQCTDSLSLAHTSPSLAAKHSAQVTDPKCDFTSPAPPAGL